jgi:hypothetical protein
MCVYVSSKTISYKDKIVYGVGKINPAKVYK